MDRLIKLSDNLGAWIGQAQTTGNLKANLPPELILYTLFARACDPVLGMIKASGQYTDEQIVEWLVTTTFAGIGLKARNAAARSAPYPQRGPR
jgi:hypothetical protein